MLPFDMSNIFFAAMPSFFMSARRSAIGSVSAHTAPTPQAKAITTVVKRFMTLSPPITRRQTPVGLRIYSCNCQ